MNDDWSTEESSFVHICWKKFSVLSFTSLHKQQFNNRKKKIGILKCLIIGSKSDPIQSNHILPRSIFFCHHNCKQNRYNSDKHDKNFYFQHLQLNLKQWWMCLSVYSFSLALALFLSSPFSICILHSLYLDGCRGEAKLPDTNFPDR